MKKLVLLFFTSAVLVHVALSIPQRRVKLTRKGVYPKLPSAAGKHRRPMEQIPNDNIFASSKPESMEGWLPKPKAEARTVPTESEEQNSVKDGFCGHSLNYGIICGVRVDQCKKDSNCPGVTKCCSVSDCGFLCVKPKDKATKPRYQKLRKRKVESKSAPTESEKTPQGLKLEDITNLPKRPTHTKRGH